MKEHCIKRNFIFYIWGIMFLCLSLSGCVRTNRKCQIEYDPSGKNINTINLTVNDHLSVSPEGSDHTRIYKTKIIMNTPGIDVAKLSDHGIKYYFGNDFSLDGPNYLIKGGEITISRKCINVDLWSESSVRPGVKSSSYFNGDYLISKPE